jgi:hypothetical protein
MNSEIDYRAIVDPLRATGQGSEVLAGALSDAWSAAYRADTPAANLYAFGPEPWTFLFDSQVRPGHRNGTERLLRGDFPLQANAPATSYQRRYPSPNGRAERPLDKGTWFHTSWAACMGRTSFRRTAN